MTERLAKIGTHENFGQIVTRYLPIVYSAAHRVLSGDVHLAQDVSQMVFINLARKIDSLPPNVSLSGWLYRDAYLSS
ncbi:MAG: RNA polymerase sigma factor, partial [Limisphaerales bacterium]